MSWAPQARERADALRARLLNGARERADAAGWMWDVRSGDGWLFATEKPASDGAAPASGGDAGILVATGSPPIFDRDAACLRDAAGIAGLLEQAAPETVARRLGTPFRFLWADRRSGELGAVTDSAGLGQVFYASEDGVALCASSALLLGSLLGAGLDLDGIAAFALFGSFPFSRTPFSGVKKLLPAGSLRLAGGKIAVEEPGAPYLSDAADARTDRRHVDDVADALAAAVRAMHQAAPDGVLELSGGVDSRLVLAALPAGDRADHRAITLNSAGELSADARIARQIARLYGIEHEIVYPLAQDQVSFALREEIPTLLRKVAVGYDGLANPVDRLPLAIVSNMETQARFGGANGEIIRGYYYPLQPFSRPASDSLLARFVDWRLSGDSSPKPAIFSAGFADHLEAARRIMKEGLHPLEGSWGSVLDRVYMQFRVQCWIGAGSVGGRFRQHTVLWPFLDAGFLQAAMAAPPGLKRDSKLAFRVLARLAPELARLPLDTGVVPAAFAGDGVMPRLRNMGITARRILRRVKRRLHAKGVETLGSGMIVDNWARSGGWGNLDLAALAGSGVLDAAFLEKAAAEGAGLDRAGLGFVTLLETWLGA